MSIQSSRILIEYRKLIARLKILPPALRGKTVLAIGSFLLLLAPLAALWADTIKLKDGTVIQGKFIGNSGDVTIIRTAEGEKRIQSDKIEQVQVGYSGVPLCYATKDKKRTCGAVLHKLGPNKAVIATGDGNTEREEIPAEEILFLEFDKRSNEKAVAVLQQGASVKLKTGDKTVEGKVQKKADGGVEIKMKDGTSRKLTEEDITGGIVTTSPFLSGQWNYLALIPGYPQIQRGQTPKGYAIMGAMGGFGLVGLVEFMNAEAVDAQAQSDFAFKFFNDQTLVKQFEAHQANQLYMGVAAGLLYLYHFFDYFTYGGPGGGPPKGDAGPAVSYDLFIGTRPASRSFAAASATRAAYAREAAQETFYAARLRIRF